MSAVNFDRIAGSYDFLSRLVFGQTLVKSQIQFLAQLPQFGKILIIGGGTGKVLEYINRPKLEVHFIEKSEKMLAKAKERKSNLKSVVFIHGDMSSVGHDYDAILTFFFLDVFEKGKLEMVIKKLAESLKPGGVWLFSDFQKPGNWYHHVLLKVMYVFFRLTVHLPANKLYDFEQLLLGQGLVIIDKRLFRKGFIKSLLLKKSTRGV